MSEASDPVQAPSPGMAGISAGTGAGGLLRQARQAQGLHIAALAAAMKVTPAKLEALEADRFNELPDATFTRALAQAVCRSLKIDAAPVLALMPPPNGHRLEQVAEGLKTPFRERPGRLAPKEWATVASVAVWGPVLLLLAAAFVYLWPAGLLQRSTAPPRPLAQAGGEASAPADVGVALPAEFDASAPTGFGIPSPEDSSHNTARDVVRDGAGLVPPGGVPSAVPGAAPGAVANAPIVPPAGSAPGAMAATAAATTAASGALQVSASEETWVGVVDAGGRTLLSRTLKAGEAVGLDGAEPFKVKIGNARVTRLHFRGQDVDLKAFTRDNIARLELK